MTVAEQELLAGMVLEVVVAAHVDRGRGLGLRRCAPLAAMSEDLRTQLEPLTEFFLYQPTRVWKVAEPVLRHHLIARAAVKRPLAHLLL